VLTLYFEVYKVEKKWKERMKMKRKRVESVIIDVRRNEKRDKEEIWLK